MRMSWVAFLAVLAISSSGWSTQRFGVPGRDGADGRNGRDGRNGDDLTFQATGLSTNLNLRGENGEDGTDAYDGEFAQSCYQPHVDQDLQGADGGSGGRAGSGGDGGRGGDLVIYTNDINHLKKIHVTSVGGVGGRSGRSAKGGRGCYCSKASWTMNKCWDEKQPDGSFKKVCKDFTYNCYHGKDGGDGSTAFDGRDGRKGRLNLIKQLDPLPVAQSHFNLKLDQILAAPVVMTAHVWYVKAGAPQLFYPGSSLANDYSEYSHTEKFVQVFAWEARKPISEFSKVELEVYLDNKSNWISTDIKTSGFWYQTRKEAQGNTQKYTFEKALWSNDAGALSQILKGKPGELWAEVTDQNKVSDLLTTTYTVMLKRDGLFGKKLYEGPVPAEAVTYDPQLHVFLLALHQLPGVKSDEFAPGKKFQLKTEVQRVFSSVYGTEVELETKFAFPKD